MNARIFSQQVLLASLCLWLGACSIYSTPGQQPAPVETRPAPTTPDEPRPAPAPTEPAEPGQPQPPEPNASNAYGPLLARAEQASAAGDYEQALALLERAQRIDPDSAEVYLALARTYSAKGDTSQARATAERGLLYCHDGSECRQLRSLAQ
ncbi:tetratricopeptide repeat protein [Parahaliea aestuarii]|uniref:Tetratricopeptide repeat protein n=1 Tax=Parahaliea aestuarii TaxID=1852021 RepID=A0A5C8ZPC5_9GAMM|nr:tetratricopeptide repeat protein [Parahaliea aestuarii]TXS89459.1 tetratricopeptide repeat protein [Parahaliea aestuarii]